MQCIDRSFLSKYADQVVSPCKKLTNKISANLFSKARIALTNAFGGGMTNLAPVYA